MDFLGEISQTHSVLTLTLSWVQSIWSLSIGRQTIVGHRAQSCRMQTLSHLGTTRETREPMKEHAKHLFACLFPFYLVHSLLSSGYQNPDHIISQGKYIFCVREKTDTH